MQESMNVRLKARLIEQRIEQKALAQKLKIASSTMSAIVQGRADPKVSLALAIAKELGTTVEYLWGDDADK